ncbi:MAG: hypothetical protein U1F68_06655 [Gammaproteobacteria bacterium]
MAATLMARVLDDDNVEQAYRLHKQLLQLGPKPTLFKPESREFFARHVEAVGRIIGVFAEGALIAYGIVGFPADTGYNFGATLGLPESALAQVAHLDGCGVLPQWRGNGLQRWLAHRRIALAVAAGRRHILSTAAPANTASCRNLLASGLQIKGLQPMFGGVLRYLLYADLAAPCRVDPSSVRIVAVTDIHRQQHLLAHGYVGHRWCLQRSMAHVYYGRPLPGSTPA